MTTITTIGNITRDFELKKGKGESDVVYVNFGLGVNEGYGEKRTTTYYECSVFGHEAKRLVDAKAKKGSLITVSGKFSISEHIRESNGEKVCKHNINILQWSYIPGTGGRKDANPDKGAVDGAN